LGISLWETTTTGGAGEVLSDEMDDEADVLRSGVEGALEVCRGGTELGACAGGDARDAVEWLEREETAAEDWTFEEEGAEGWALLPFWAAAGAGGGGGFFLSLEPSEDDLLLDSCYRKASTIGGRSAFDRVVNNAQLDHELVFADQVSQSGGTITDRLDEKLATKMT
jgi:hypothetical protein